MNNADTASADTASADTAQVYILVFNPLVIADPRMEDNTALDLKSNTRCAIIKWAPLCCIKLHDIVLIAYILLIHTYV